MAEKAVKKGTEAGPVATSQTSSMTREDAVKEFERRMRESVKRQLDQQGKESFSSSSSGGSGGDEDRDQGKGQGLRSREYLEFRHQYMPSHLSWYEKACNLSEKVFKIGPDKKEEPLLQEAINICHLNVTPTGAKSFSILAPFMLVIVVFLTTFVVPYILTNGNTQELFFTMFAVLAGLILIIPLGKLPYFFANSWRLEASNQMVLCTFYMVTYMRHTSNLENAIDFAAEHLSPPLSLDLKKVMWNLETEKFDSVKESLDDYLETWKKWNMEFIESVHLIESSLYEPAEERRLNALDKALSVMLEETYEKMLHYAHNLQSPLAMLHMLGIILPILGLVILPLLVSFMDQVKWYHIMMLYNVALPIGVYYLGKSILASRPTGYGEADISAQNPELRKYKDFIIRIGTSEIRISPLYLSIIVFVVLLLLGFLPLIWHTFLPDTDLAYSSANGFQFIGTREIPDGQFYFLGYRTNMQKGHEGEVIGPYGLGAAIISMCIPLAFGLAIGLYYRQRSGNLVKIRERAKKLEQEFAAALFQLGNRLGDQLPPEIAFSKVAKVMEGTISGSFFELVSSNISKLGMSVEQAIFDRKQGALRSYPSNLIESSMKVLVESSKKGPLVASQAVINVSEYIKEMHRVDERLKDLMADIISSMKSQAAFLAPAIAGIVIGITSMIIAILGNLTGKLNDLAAQSNNSVAGAGLLSLFGNGVPTYFFQIIVGMYVVQIVYILSVLINGIQNGADRLNEEYMLGRNMINSTVLYVVIAFTIVLIFNLIAASILGSIQTTAL